MSDTRLLPVRGRDGRYSGDLPSEAAREIARRLRAGESYEAISAALGMRKATGRRKCAEVARTIGMPVQESRHVVFAREVAALVDEGLTDREISDRLNRTIHSVAAARHRALGAKYKVVRLTAEEHATIDRMILEGFNQYEIAREVGCNQTLVSTRAKRLDLSQVKHTRAPCACGKAAGHGGRCNLVVDPGFIRERLLAGATTADIARECGRTAQSFKPKYVQPVIDQLTAEGHRCGCGQPFGHQFVCSVTMAVQRRKFTDEQRQIAAEMVRRGVSVRAVREALAITVNSANLLVGQVRASLANEGVRCPCGQPIDHSRSCSARNGEAKGRTTFRFSSATAAKMTPERRRSISKLARAGYGCKPICDRTGESEWRVDVLIAELRDAGLTPAKCATCDNPFNHKGPCVLPKRCRCGRWRNHRGPCRKPGPRLTVARGEKPPQIDPALRRQAMLRYRDGDSIQRISDATGISWGVVQRLVAYWRKKSPYEQKPCECGRPARHSGGCIKNTPGAVSKLEKARIVSATREGDMPHTIAEKLGVHVQTVLKHSAAVRDEMFADGISCACGRPVGHPYWCSAKWDAYEQPRGRRPFGEPRESLAIEALVRGDVVAAIAREVRVGTDSIWKLRRSLTDEQRALRTAAIRARIARGGKVQGDEIMARIRSAVSRSIDPAVRDDIEAELYLAVIEGRIEAEQIKSAVRSFVSRGLAEWRRGTSRSLDQKVGEGTSTFGDLVGDTTATLSIDEIEIGQPPP
ncbi:MAG: hypothetical protein GY736_20080 [Sphingomonas sp.]|uniref:hypothetical protein n=1 Tax=Sphingomonas sp. TaxID=28214 RepID=UPI0025860770|nr:hypothetical protein [Sphingomonas sp.]MCP4028589.1 hypothetical protein [Sphingomonas sp.]